MLTSVPPPRQIKLSIQDVSKRYGAITALQSTSLQVATGEFLTLLGPSGSGKTTLLNLIAGLVSCDSGRVVLDGKDITHAAPQHRGLGMVFQNYALFPHLTVAQNIAFGLDVRGKSEAAMAKRVAEVLAMVRLEAFADRLPKELSGGQQQRVALARAFAYEPAVVLMDEPLGALDRYLREEMKTEIARLHKELGTTVIYVTHDQEEALVLSDRVCLMNQACIEQLDTAENLYAAPRTRFAAEFLGESNLLDAQVDADGQHATLHNLNVSVPLLNTAQPGAKGHALARPESVQFSSSKEDTDWTLISMQFIGASRRYILQHRCGQQMTATQPNNKKFENFKALTHVSIDYSAMYFIANNHVSQ
jgi:putative spermidine/putrescine transport system ATP-binding protein